MAAIYDKALKRKDYSGVTTKAQEELPKRAEEPEAEPSTKKAKGKKRKDKKEVKKDKDNADDPKAGADIGKIVNLMAGDANRVSCAFA